MIFLLRSLGRLPLTTLYGFSWVVYFVTFHLLRWRRELAARNIARSFPDKTPAEHAVILQQSYRNMSEVFVELLWGWRASAEQLKARLVIDNPELVARFLEAPVVYVAMRRLKRGHYALHLHVLAEPPYDITGEPETEAGAWIVEAYARKLEEEIRASPSDWLWVHNKWKYPRPAPKRNR